MNLARAIPKLRTSEWVLIGYFGYVVLIAPFFPDRPHLKFQPALVLIAVSLLLSVLAILERDMRFERVIGRVRDWLPILVALIAFREMELFLPTRYDHSHENTWIKQDHLLLTTLQARAAIESLGPLIPWYLELCYFLVYGLSACCIAILYLRHKPSLVDSFFVVYLCGTLAAYALFPYFPSQPPRLAFAGADDPSYSTWIRQLNLFTLSKATIHSGVFPSAHVSSAFSAAWAMFVLLPERKAIAFGLLGYAISVSVATVYGRYHYCADVLSGFGVSLLAALVCVTLAHSHGHEQRAD